MLSGAGEQKVDHDLLDRERLAGAGAGVDNLVPAVENLVEDRGAKIFEVGGECGRAHLNIPIIGSKRRSTICSIVSSSGGSKSLALRTGP